MHAYIVLEAGGTGDTLAFMNCMDSLGGVDLNPPGDDLASSQRDPPCVFTKETKKIFTLRNLTTDELLKNEKIHAYVKKIEQTQPKWVYLSGHTGTYGYTGEMNSLPEGKGHAYYTFQEGAFYLTDNGAKKFWKKIETATPGRSCVAILTMGCAVTGNAHHMNNLQRAFGAGGAPVILGWKDSCPAEDVHQEFVLKAFLVERVKQQISGDVLPEHRDRLVSLWGEVAVKYYPNMGAFDHQGRRWGTVEEKGERFWRADR